jgi:hypothetical protein
MFKLHVEGAPNHPSAVSKPRETGEAWAKELPRDLEVGAWAP